MCVLVIVVGVERWVYMFIRFPQVDLFEGTAEPFSSSIRRGMSWLVLGEQTDRHPRVPHRAEPGSCDAAIGGRGESAVRPRLSDVARYPPSEEGGSAEASLLSGQSNLARLLSS